MTVLVAMGYWKVPDLVERAVRSVLAQTYTDLQCLVIGDGEEPPLSHVRDDRLEVYTLPENHGAYFALQLALEASPHRWFAPFAADDMAEPEHIETLGAVAASHRVHAVTAAAVYWGVGTDEVHHGNYEVGVFRKDRLMAFGGWDPSARIAQDTLLIHLLRVTGSVAACTTPTYHRIKRPYSLTTTLETGLRSPARLKVRDENRRILAHCKRLRRPSAIAAYRAGLVPEETRDALAEHSARLSARLGKEVLAA